MFLEPRRFHPLVKALLSQTMACLCAWGVGWMGLGSQVGLWGLVAGQAVLAAMVSRGLHADAWWTWIHLGFVPLLMAALQFQWPSWIFLVAFAALALVYGPSYRTQVPLYLSNRATTDVLVGLLPKACLRFMDFGSGNAAVLAGVAQALPAVQCEGIEGAWLPYWLGRWRIRRLPNCLSRRGDFWSESLHGFDAVYTFLSPAVMPRVWEKARNEMPKGGVLISNSFPVPGVKPRQVVDVADGRKTRLYLYII